MKGGFALTLAPCKEQSYQGGLVCLPCARISFLNASYKVFGKHKGKVAISLFASLDLRYMPQAVAAYLTNNGLYYSKP